MLQSACPHADIPDEKERERARNELEGRITILKDAAKNLDDPGMSVGLEHSCHKALQVPWSGRPEQCEGWCLRQRV